MAIEFFLNAFPPEFGILLGGPRFYPENRLTRLCLKISSLIRGGQFKSQTVFSGGEGEDGALNVYSQDGLIYRISMTSELKSIAFSFALSRIF